MLRKVCPTLLVLVLVLILSATALAEIPGKPQNITVDLTEDEYDVRIVWTDPEKGAPITSYEVSDDGVTWTDIGLSHDHVIDAGPYKGRYPYYIRAVNADGPGPAVNVITIHTVDKLPPNYIEPAYYVEDTEGLKYITSALEVRAGAGADYEVIDHLPVGTIVHWINWDRTGDWWRIMYNDDNSAGWVRRTSVRWRTYAYPTYGESTTGR